MFYKSESVRVSIALIALSATNSNVERVLDSMSDLFANPYFKSKPFMKDLSLLIEPPVFDLLINPFAYFSIALKSVSKI